MFPVLFEIPALPAWIAALAVALLGAVFLWLGRRGGEDGKADSGSWWLAGACGLGAVAIAASFGLTATIGPLPIRLFGLLVVAGFLLAAKAASMRNRARGLLSGEETFDAAFYVLLAGLAGGRLLHVIQHTGEFSGKPLDVLKIWDGGLVWYGGAVGGTLYLWYWLAKKGKDLWAVSDSFALALPLGHAVGRLGCFAAGCDYGRVVEGGREAVPWAVHFPDSAFTLVPPDFRYDPETDADLYLHPVQLYLALMNLAVFAILLWVDRKATKGAFRGRLVALYLCLYAVGRGTVEHWRGDADRGTYDLGILRASFSQLVSVAVLVAGVMLYRSLARRKRPADGAA